MIIVEVKNEILGDSEFWRGPADRICEIRNIPARITAQQVVQDGKPRVCGMWHVRLEEIAMLSDNNDRTADPVVSRARVNVEAELNGGI